MIPDAKPSLPQTYRDQIGTLPGTIPYKKSVERMIRVDHAGEFGAVHIYRGQLAVLKGTKSEDTIRHMYEQEQHHLATFEALVVKHRVRPTILSPIWRRAGFALGAVTALMGEKVAMACTAAVEDVIDDHYSRQRDQLSPEDQDLQKTIEQFRQDEVEHRRIAQDQGAEETPVYPVLSQAIKAGSKLAIFLSERF